MPTSTASPIPPVDTPTPEPAPVDTRVTTAQVINIVDGDTIDVLINGEEYRVRYILVNTPERGQHYYSEATAANAALVANQTVTLVKDVSETDRYGRLLRYVYLADGTFVNAELVRQGYAQIATFPPDVAMEAEIRAAQSEAQANGRGLWAGHVEVVPSEAPVVEETKIEETEETNEESGIGGQPRVVIETIFYDGDVPRVESDEYAVITNTGDAPQDITGWRLNADDNNQDFYFPNYTLAPGESCRVYTNEVHPETCGFSFGIPKAIWANDGECGHLYDANGVEVSSYCY